MRKRLGSTSPQLVNTPKPSMSRRPAVHVTM
jgi:hypothetical protein